MPNSHAPGEQAKAVERADMLAGILSIATDAIISVDDAFVVTLFSDGAESIFGYAREEIIGKPLSLLLPERHREAHDRHIQAFSISDVNARRMGERAEIMGRRKNGETFHAEASISKLRVGDRNIYTAVLRDVSERRAAASQLSASKQVLEIALDIGEVGIFEHDHANGTVYWSRHYRRILGVGERTPACMTAYVDLLHPDDRASVVAAIARARDYRGDGHFSSEHRVVRSDGEIRWLACRANTSFAEGKPVRTIGAVLDITERREAQTRLEERVTAATRDLRLEMKRREDSHAQLVRTQRMEAFGQLTGGVAHDFNNLLTVIAGNLELLEMRLDDERGRILARRAIDAAEMGARLTGRLLTFARRRKFAAQLLNLNDQVIGTAELLERTLGAHIALATSLERTPWTVLADPSEIENAILNLAINARDAMPGGGKLFIETTNLELTEDRKSTGLDLPPGQYVRLSVSDTGSGMPPEVLKRALEPFFTTKETGRGTGLGLSTIYGFVTDAKGTVTIYSEPGQGTTVNIYLPRALAAGAIPDSKTSKSPTPISAGERILLVEDNPDVRAVTRAQLEMLGYDVVEAESGPAALRVLAGDKSFVLVLSDVVMAGGMSGFDVVRWLRANAPGTRVLLASGYPDALLRSDGAEPEAVDILRKPFTRAELAHAVRRTLDAT
jgi:PAS domain S-box-containing protein